MPQLLVEAPEKMDRSCALPVLTSKVGNDTMLGFQMICTDSVSDFGFHGVPDTY